MGTPPIALASSLGYTSIGCWLCAQLPQVVKNLHLKSCEGLSLPFLVNWLFGDLTNLIGCLLTDQLPFQTYLAGWFCVIDSILLVQYFYYRRPKPLIQYPHHHHHVHYSSVVSLPPTAVTSPQQPQGPTLSLASPTVSTLSPAAVSTTSSSTVLPPSGRGKRKHSSTHGFRSQSTSQIFGADLAGLGMTSPQLPVATDSYQDLYQAALDVARAAERVSSRRSESRRRRLSRQTTSNTMGELDEDGNGNEGGMMDSFHSEMSAHTSSTIDADEQRDRKRMSQSTGNIGMTDARDARDARGRSMRRAVVIPPTPVPGTPREELDHLESLPGLGGAGERPAITRSKSRSLSVVRTTSGRGKGRRAAGVAFMSLGILAGFGRYPESFSSRSPGSGSTGTVIGTTSQTHNSISESSVSLPIRHPQPFVAPSSLHPGHSRAQSQSATMPYLMFEHPSHPEPPEGASIKRLFGRTSAWACTTLYLTSRLPQIWKNFMRKSVEGLSIFLFFFAFCGNLTYVASILLNPAGSASPSDAGHYILEALPYLLGSGGTLLFDLTIMIQSWIYGSSPPIDESSPIIPRRKATRRGIRRSATAPGSYLEEGPVSSKLPYHQAQGQGGERQPLLVRDRSTSPETITVSRRNKVTESPVDHDYSHENGHGHGHGHRT